MFFALVSDFSWVFMSSSKSVHRPLRGVAVFKRRVVDSSSGAVQERTTLWNSPPVRYKPEPLNPKPFGTYLRNCHNGRVPFKEAGRKRVPGTYAMNSALRAWVWDAGGSGVKKSRRDRT